MQLQPFRRPSIVSAEATRDFLVARLFEICGLYRSATAQEVEFHRPKPGDLHDWDKLVDGCLYYDSEAEDSRPYMVRATGKWLWVGDAKDIDDDWYRETAWGEYQTTAQNADKAIVTASSLSGLQAFKDAITNDIIARNEARGAK